MSDDSKQSARLVDWQREIGHFILNFGQLDWLFLVFLEKSLETPKFEVFRKRSFQQRTKRIARFLKEKDYPANQQAEFSHLLSRVDHIRNLRNHIAHAHLLLRWDPETNTLIPTASLPKDLDRGNSPDTRHVTFADLRSSLTELTALIEAFKVIAEFKPGWQSGDCVRREI